jgi:hypothetical protein
VKFKIKKKESKLVKHFKSGDQLRPGSVLAFAARMTKTLV